MNTNDYERDELPRDDDALLTAAILGELDDDERRALDARLDAEPELAARRDALAATIGLVQDAFPKGESLPSELLASLERAAAGSAASTTDGNAASTLGPRALDDAPRIPWLRMAAGLTLLCGGVIAANEYFTRKDDPREDRLAGVDGADRGDAPQAEFGYGLSSGIDKRGAKGPAGSVETRASRGEDAKRQELVGAALRDHGDANFEAPPEEVLADVDRYAGSRGGLTKSAPVDGAALPREAPAQGDRPGAASGYAGGAGETFRGPGDSVPPGGRAGGGPSEAKDQAWSAGVPVTESATPQAPSTLTIGRSGEEPDPSVLVVDAAPNTAPSPEPALKAKGNANEPAARARLGTSAGPATPGPAGPSSPGPRRPASGATEREVLDALDALGGLGYVGGGGAAPGGETGAVVRRFDGGTTISVDPDVNDRFAGGAVDTEAGRGRFDFSLEERKRDYAGRLQYSEEELAEIAKARADIVLQSCRRRPNERPSMMFYRFYGDNAFELAHLDALSTFGADVDTASYTLARRYLVDGVLPEKAQIRTEEFVNYFRPDLAPPPADSTVPFAVHTELSDSRFGTDRWAQSGEGATQRQMLRVGIRGKEVAREERRPLQLTFVVDTSGSMQQENRMELVKHALRLLVTELDARDSIAIVAFSNEARQVLPMTSAANRGLIESAIHGLTPNGGTNAEAGLMMGYETASLTLAPGNHSRVVLLSDGVANIGQTDQDRVNDSVKRQRDRGIYLNTVGVGMGNHNDVFLEQLANKGDGLCNYVDDEREARRALVENFTGAFETIARDLKVQVEFDPSQVYRYRLLGYENRAIADADFRNDKVDAGEIGAGHQVVALYELELTGNASEAPMATVRVRWKAPTGAGRDPLEDTAAGEIAHPVGASTRTAWEGASAGFRRDACIAQFAEILRRSVHARGDSLDELIAEASKLDAELRDADVTEFVVMLRRSRELILQHAPQHTDLSDCVDALRRNRILRAQLEEVRRDRNDELLRELETQNAQLETRIRDLIRDELDQQLK